MLVRILTIIIATINNIIIVIVTIICSVITVSQ